MILTWKQYFGISVTLSSFTQILISVGLSWFLCFVLTATGVFTDDPNGWGYGARTDIKTDVLTKTSWFRFPYPGIIVFGCAISQLFSYDAYQTFFFICPHERVLCFSHHFVNYARTVSCEFFYLSFFNCNKVYFDPAPRRFWEVNLELVFLKPTKHHRWNCIYSYHMIFFTFVQNNK